MAQDAFIKAYRALPQFRGESAFYTWLYRIAVNTAKNYLATQGRRAPTSTEADAEEAETFSDADQLRDINTPESMLMSKQIAETVNAAMALLPEELRQAITLREIEGLSYEEAATIEQVPVGTIKSRVVRGRQMLRALMDHASRDEASGSEPQIIADDAICQAEPPSIDEVHTRQIELLQSWRTKRAADRCLAA